MFSGIKQIFDILKNEYSNRKCFAFSVDLYVMYKTVGDLGGYHQVINTLFYIFCGWSSGLF